MEYPMCARKGAYEVDVVEGQEYFWCACGHSKTQPYCDGSHKGTGYKPHVFTAAHSGKVEICGCKRTKTRPFCDGSHEQIETGHLAT
jgi:CDGSH-type Zn-finger protein